MVVLLESSAEHAPTHLRDGARRVQRRRSAEERSADDGKQQPPVAMEEQRPMNAPPPLLLTAARPPPHPIASVHARPGPQEGARAVELSLMTPSAPGCDMKRRVVSTPPLQHR